VPQFFADRITAEIERLREETVSMQTREQLEDKLKRCGTELELVRRELESFNHAVSHDLRGPLRAIEGFSESLAEDYGNQLDDAARDYLQRIHKNVRRMDRLLQALLSLSRVTRHVLQPAQVDLSHLCNKRLERLQDREPQRRASLHIQPDIHACGDPELLALALEQLLANAWKYTGHGRETCIEFSAKQQDGRTVYCIKDNGVGFNMAYSDKLFEIFQRLHGQQEFEGVGAGLAIVKRIIERHNGTIWAESEVGNGACFYFTLPEQPCTASDSD
jgi:light-regulated signal transduction histidine kinase (bacteriophytochrome)